VRIHLLCVGKPRERLFVELHDRYAERLARLGIRYDTSWVPEVASGGRFVDEHVREREAIALLARAGESGALVALDPRGGLLSSEELATRLERWAVPGVTFVIGGPLGLHDSLLRRADWSWSFSPLTFPHELVRGLLAEQIYRAITLQRGLPYHKRRSADDA
jgi:23S rRNA (pseudouridine1915-N3)-methyltransferase